jgi:hypothetical protein
MEMAMPKKWQPPEKFIDYAGLVVYHTYDDEMVSDIWYTVIQENDDVGGFVEDGIFCVEDIPTPATIDPRDHQAVIRYAIDQGWLTGAGLYLPEELAP